MKHVDLHVLQVATPNANQPLLDTYNTSVCLLSQKEENN